MPNKKQKGSWSYTVEQIFGEGCDAFALDTLKGRLKTYCNEIYLSKMPKEYVHQGTPSPHKSSIRFTESSYPYIENLLLLDSLIGSPTQVMEIMTRHTCPSRRLAKLREICAKKRKELKKRLDIELQTVEESKAWERLPENFDLNRQSLSRIHLPSQQNKKMPSASRAARFAAWERMREIDQGETSPENIAEKAFYLIRMGQRDLGLGQIEDALKESPQHSLLHFVKGVAFLDEAQSEQRQSDLHTILIDESEPLSGAEHHHEEQAFNRAEKAFQSRLTATKALLDAHRHWPDHLPYNWFTSISPWELQQQVVETILANGLFLASSGRKPPAKLIKFLLAIVSGKGLPRPLISPDMFPTLGRCLAMAHLLGEGNLSGELIDRWLQKVELDESKTMGELTISPTYFIRENQPWLNPWTKLIAAYISQNILASPITRHKGTAFFTEFAEKHIRLNAEHELQRIFSQLNEQFWLELVRCGENNHEPETSSIPELKRRVAVCEQALEELPWSSSAYAGQWQNRWIYGTARSLFDLSVCYLSDHKFNPARKTIKQAESLAEAHPKIRNKKLTHFVVSYIDEDGHASDWDEPLDILGHSTNIFVSKRDISLNPNTGMGLFHPFCFDDDFETFCSPQEMEVPVTHREIVEKASKLRGTAVERLKSLIGKD